MVLEKIFKKDQLKKGKKPSFLENLKKASIKSQKNSWSSKLNPKSAFFRQLRKFLVYQGTRLSYHVTKWIFPRSYSDQMLSGDRK
jgi:hypothetical protein